ncbi:hypothetical protein F5884DRAFT_195753 [Xylogone sp. PMI_703]|nr:hypothetical protein F5884DRAFT_195753 [Xylogone sp. PMI_703]
MNSSYICSTCRRKVSQIRQQKLLQWGRQASFVPLGDQPQTKSHDKSKHDLLDIVDERDKKPRRPGPQLPGPRRRIRRTANNDPGDLLESLFEASLRPPNSTVSAVQRRLKSLEPYKNAETLSGMLGDKDCPIGDAWEFFVQHFGPEAWEKGIIDQKSCPSYLKSSARILLKRIISAKADRSFPETLPTVTDVTRVYAWLGMLQGVEWIALMEGLHENILRSISRDSGMPTERLVSDLLCSWNFWCRRRGSPPKVLLPGTEEFPLDWSDIPSLMTSEATQKFQNGGIGELFGVLIPQLSSVLQALPAIVLGTFTILSDKHIADLAMVKEAVPFTLLLARMIFVCDFQPGQIEDANGAVAAFVKARWAGTKDRISNMVDLYAEEPHHYSRAINASRVQESPIYIQLRDGLARKDMAKVNALWVDVTQWPVQRENVVIRKTAGSGESSRINEDTLSPALCDDFILAYMTLRHPSGAIDVWNHMIKTGLEPSLASWNAMLVGCRTAKNWKALEQVWAKMMASGVKPDVVCWTTRISGLIEGGRFDKAIRVLNDMGRIWLSAVKEKHGILSSEEMRSVPDINGIAKPTVETVNAAIASFLRQQQTDAAQLVLTWAGKLGIKPDVITYNTLLRPLIRGGNIDQATLLLKEMQEQGIEADVATFTTILDESFADPVGPDEQKEVVSNIFAEMQAAGIQANLHTYGKIIYHLLENTKGDMRAVDFVMERMARQGLKPSTYIYTILVEHYFAREPPDLDAARALIEHSRTEVGSVDHIFWDRVIEGYATVGETGLAMEVLENVNSGHLTPSWLTLKTLLAALVRNGEWAVAKMLVQRVKSDTGGPIPDHERGKEGQHRFWRFVRELDLLDA